MYHLVNVYRNTRDTSGIVRKLEVVKHRIVSGANGLDKKSKQCRRLAIKNKSKYRAYKEQHLPAFTPSGTFPQYKRKAQYLAKHSGLIVIDIDDLTDEQRTELLVALSQRSDIILCFISPSNKGIKLILVVTPIPKNACEHKYVYRKCLEHISPFTEEYDFKIDTGGSDCSRLCFLAHHPQAIWNPNPEVITWDYQVYLHEQEARRVELEKSIGNTNTTIEVLDYIDPDTDYHTWLRVGLACYNASLPFSTWDNWSRQGEKYKQSEMQKKWESFGNGYTENKVTWGTVVYYATLNGYVVPTQADRTTYMSNDRHDPIMSIAYNTLRKRKY